MIIFWFHFESFLEGEIDLILEHCCFYFFTPKMDYSDNEIDYNSEQYVDNNDSNETFDDDVLNVLKKLANRNNIKAIRQFISIHKNRLKGYKTRLLNEAINVNGYKFFRRDGKLILSKICPSSRYYKGIHGKPIERSSLEYGPYPKESGQAFNDVESNADFEGLPDDSSYIEPSGNTKFHEMHPMYPNKAQSNETNKSITPRYEMNKDEIGNSNDMPSVNRDRDETIQTNPLGSQTKQLDNKMNGNFQLDNQKSILDVNQMDSAPKTISLSDNTNYSPQLATILNSIYKQTNEQNENQRTQYEKLTNILKDSIQAKSNLEQEQINKFNKCVESIEKTFSAGTFDKIVEHIDNMVKTLLTKQEAKNSEFNSRIDDLDTDISNLMDKSDKLDIAFNQMKYLDNDSLEDNETITDMNISIDELRDKIQEQENTIKTLQTNILNISKQHADLINKLSLAVYNIDESVHSQIFKQQAEKEPSEETVSQIN